MTAAAAADCFRFGRFELQQRERRLLADGVPVTLGPRAFDVLVMLVQRAGRLVTKDELLEHVWPRVVVEDNTLQAQVSALRKILGRDAIATVSGRGYRFTLELAVAEPAGAPRTPTHNLPQYLTSFIGRGREIAELRQMLSTVRLLTLTGTGGCGKTRLAMQVASDVLHAYDDGVWLLDLSALTDPLLVPQTLARVIGVKEQPGKSLTQAAVDDLERKHALIIVDNAEHVRMACAQLADEVLRRCANVRLLVTSRERLGITGELTYRVPPLGVPDPRFDVTPQHITQCDSASLFIERARLQRPDFAITDENAAALASICRRLDGIPLAIELAAPRVRAMSVQEVDQRLDRLFSLLTGGSVTALPRQRTLRSLIDWSYDLLSDAEQALLRRFSVFAGGFTLEAAEHVCSGDSIREEDTLDLVASLCDKSLVMTDEHDRATRYRLLETVRRYAHEWLQEHGEEARWLGRHLDYFVMLAEAAEPSLRGAPDQQAWLRRIEIEHDNVRAVLSRSANAANAANAADAAAGLRLAAALWRFWWMRGYVSEGRAWLDAMLRATPGEEVSAVRAKALNGAGVLAWLQGDFGAARSNYERCLEISRALGDFRTIALSLNNLAIVHSDQGDYAAARSNYEECVAIQRQLGDRRAVGNSLSNLGNLMRDIGDLQVARVLLEESLATRRELQDRHGIATSLINLAVVARDQGDYVAAVALAEECLAISREVGERRNIAASLGHLGVVACEQGNAPCGRAMLKESVEVCRAIGDRYALAESLGGLAFALVSVQPRRAATLFGAVERLREVIGSPRKPKDRPRYDRHVAAARAAVADDFAFDRAWKAGRAMDLDEAVRYALDYAT